MFLKKEFKLWEDDLWFTSDTHYAHKNICRGVSQWDTSRNGTRDFKDLDDMNDAIVKGINDNVKENSHLFHAGDWSFGGKEKILEFSKRLECSNIYLTYGNHDHHIRGNALLDSYITSKSLFKATDEAMYINFKRTPSSKVETLYMAHYAHLVWDASHKGSMHVFGHSHASINDACVSKSMDIGIDNAFIEFGEFRPFHIKEVLAILDKKSVKKLDHHDSNTSR